MVNRQVNRRDKDSGGGFVYRGSDPKKLKERSEQTGGQFDSIFKNGIDSYKPKQGSNVVRILPPTYTDHDHFGLEVWQHGYVGADKSTYLCRDKMLGKRCPVCEAAKEAKAAGEDKDYDQLKAKKRYLYWVLDRNGDVDTPQVWSVAWTMDRDIAALCRNERTGKIIQIDHPDHGYDLMLKRTGQQLNTRYVGLQVDRDPSPVDESKKAQREIIDYIVENPLDAILKYYPEEHLAKAMEGTVADKDEDLDDKPSRRERVRDDDDKPRSRRSASRDDDGDEEEKPRGRRSRDEDEEDDKPKRRARDADEDEDKPRRRSRDEDEDDKPKRRAARDEDEDDQPKRRRAPVDEDEDDKPRRRVRDDDEDDKPKRRSRDDDEDDKPKRRSRDDDEEDTRERARGRSRDEEDDDRPSRTSRRGKTEDDEDDKPRRRAARDEDEDPADDDPKDRGDDEDDKPKRRSRR